MRTLLLGRVKVALQAGQTVRDGISSTNAKAGTATTTNETQEIAAPLGLVSPVVPESLLLPS